MAIKYYALSLSPGDALFHKRRHIIDRGEALQFHLFKLNADIVTIRLSSVVSVSPQDLKTHKWG